MCPLIFTFVDSYTPHVLGRVVTDGHYHCLHNDDKYCFPAIG